jgi:hypothetical protein
MWAYFKIFLGLTIIGYIFTLITGGLLHLLYLINKKRKR